MKKLIIFRDIDNNVFDLFGGNTSSKIHFLIFKSFDLIRHHVGGGYSYDTLESIPSKLSLLPLISDDNNKYYNKLETELFHEINASKRRLQQKQLDLQRQIKQAKVRSVVLSAYHSYMIITALIHMVNLNMSKIRE